MSDSIPESKNSTLFDKLNALVKREKKPEKRLVRHSQEREIIDIALANLSLSEKGQKLVDFVKEKDIRISILRGQDTRDYTTTAKEVFVSVRQETDIDDPAITIHLAAAIREAMHEYDLNLKTPSPHQSEAIYVHRMGQKDDDKLIWQTIIVYELGKISNKTEFIDSFALMGYYSLIDVYEKDLTEYS